jgi:UDP:flavonoid glycosyltransferase YjiC (YdhE family)
MLDGTLDLFEAYRPDLVISEPNEYAGSIAATKFGIPWVEHGWGIMGMPEFKPASAAELAPELNRLGQPGLTDPDLIIDTCPPSLREEPADGALPMRYVPYNGAAVAPDWVFEERTRPRVCVTFGGVLPRYGRKDFRGMLREWTHALPGLGVELVVAVADDLTAQWSPLPEGVRTAGWLPLSLTLPACDVVVHHGGVGSTLTTVIAGLPQLLTPQLVDQFENARRITALGAGLSLQPEELTTAAVVEKVAELLADTTFGKCARTVAEENAKRPTPAEVATQLEEFVADRS